MNLSKKKYVTILPLMLFILVSGCAYRTEPKDIVSIPADNIKNEQMIMGILWIQHAAEYRALAYQAFNVAKIELDRTLSEKATASQKLAVLVDVDETVLDNSYFQVKGYFDETLYPSGWQEWVERGEATAVPGAVEFLNYAAQQGVDVFYVTNRHELGLAGSMRNLADLGFPQVDEAHMYFKVDESTKEPRRQKIAETHEIVLLIGDNLNDFSNVFEKGTIEERFDQTDKFKDEFGHRFIVLPNPMYGEWESAIYNYDWNQSEAKKDQIRKSLLKKK